MDGQRVRHKQNLRGLEVVRLKPGISETGKADRSKPVTPIIGAQVKSSKEPPRPSRVPLRPIKI
jgi:hypothetical protein